MTSRPGSLLLAVLVSAVLLLPSAAHAEKVVTEDPAGDVVGVGPTEQGEDDLANLVPAPDNTSADVVRTTVDHGDSRLRVRIDLRELGGARLYFAALRVRTPARDFEVEIDDLGRKPRADMTRGSKAVECRRLRAESDDAAARVVVTIPTVCLADPRWVQVGVGVASAEKVTNADGVEEIVVHGDDAHRAGDIRDRIALGPKVRRG
jgi:hypothetical protein